MKACFVCSWCGQIVPTRYAKRHYTINKNFSSWDIKEEAKKPRKLTISNLTEFDWNRPACQGMHW